ncbi:MAG TPA: NAD(P)H-binding protein [Gammaproteobacteria bacterium]|nr:NAD(P)H-binding protein [Gammaproteobacteria bacterium]
MPTRTPLLVTGAAGNLGRQVVEQLLETNAGPIIATTRTPEKLADFAKRGVDVRAADFNDLQSLVDAFRGAERLLLISTGDLFPEGARLRQHRAAVQAAVDAGVKHVVYTSGPAPHPTPKGALINDHYWTEQALAASPLEWTILRHHIYTDFLVGTLAQALKFGVLSGSAGDGGNNYVTRADCARADAAALAADFSGRRILDVTGPAPVTPGELVNIASALAGKPLRYQHLTRAEHEKMLLGFNLPPFLVDALASFDEAQSQGHLAIRSPAVFNLTGKAPTSVQEYLTAQRPALLAAASS